MTRLALGLRAHIGWSAGVLLAEPVDAPVVIRRFRLDLVDPDKPESHEPYHAARELSLDDAQRLIIRASRTIGTLALGALTDCIEGVQTSEIVGACVITSSAKPRDIESTLRSHLQVHVAEGDLIRDALRSACRTLSMPVTSFRERALFDEADRILEKSAMEVTKQLGTLGKAVGVPWAQDQKLCALAAWLTLATA
ncbi:MAG: hypothetical protein V3T15_03980 [Pseudomonadales bacterium]